MNKQIFKIQIFLFIIALLCLSKNAFPAAYSEVLITDHFYINFENSNSSSAAATAVILESYNEKITSFLETEIMHKINVSLTSDNSAKIPFFKKNDELYISSYGNFNDPDKIIYRDLFKLYLQSITGNGRASSIVNDSFTRALMNYSTSDSEFSEFVITDLVNNCGINTVEINNIKKFNESFQYSIYTAMIDFIVSEYGKKILIQAIKDAAHYHDFFQALLEITGETEKFNSEKFKVYLQKHKSDVPPDSINKKTFHKDDGDFEDISYSVSVSGQLAVLQKKGASYRIQLKTGESEKFLIPYNYESGSVFNNIVFAGSEKIAVSEIIKSGSRVQIYEIQTGRISGEVILPYLFISDISFIDNGKFIFSAGCGLNNDIYTLDLYAGKLTIITETGNNFSPVMLNNKVYYISNTVKNSIMELDTKSGIIKTLFSTDQKIAHLNKTDKENLIFSMKLNGQENIYTMDLPSENLRRLTNDFSSDISPIVSGEKLFYLTFFQSRYRLFITDYNPADR